MVKERTYKKLDEKLLKKKNQEISKLEKLLEKAKVEKEQIIHDFIFYCTVLNDDQRGYIRVRDEDFEGSWKKALNSLEKTMPDPADKKLVGYVKKMIRVIIDYENANKTNLGYISKLIGDAKIIGR